MEPTTRTNPPADRRGVIEPFATLAQSYAAVAGLFLVVLGVLALIIPSVTFGAVHSLASRPDFLIWTVSGWTTLFWIAMGALGLMAMVRFDTARSYALFAGVVFVVVAIWGFINGTNVASVLAASTANNVTHAVLGVLGLMTAMAPRGVQRRSLSEGMTARLGEGREAGRTASRRHAIRIGHR